MAEIDPERQFIVVLKGHAVTWGPFFTRSGAEAFAAFVTEEIDPAEAWALSSPVGELLAWRESVQHLIELGINAEPEGGQG